MNPEPENFESLRRLLALKRHEQPPPGYFNSFSGKVVARITAGEKGDQSGEPKWLQRLWQMLEARPILGGAFGAGICAVLISGILNSEDPAGAGSATAFSPSVSQVAGVPSGIAPVESNGTPLDSETNSITALSELFNIQPGLQPPLQHVHGSFIVPGN
jgi:hypothetical protein